MRLIAPLLLLFLGWGVWGVQPPPKGAWRACPPMDKGLGCVALDADRAVDCGSVWFETALHGRQSCLHTTALLHATFFCVHCATAACTEHPHPALHISKWSVVHMCAAGVQQETEEAGDSMVLRGWDAAGKQGV